MNKQKKTTMPIGVKVYLVCQFIALLLVIFWYNKNTNYCSDTYVPPEQAVDASKGELPVGCVDVLEMGEN